jgi:hypothetical protein
MASFTGESVGLDMTPAGDIAQWRSSLDIKPTLSAWDDENKSSRSKGKYLPVLYSLLIPGTGEIALGYPKRGVALIALEVIAWSGYAYYNNKGLDGRAEFEAFADEHWNEDKWLMDHLVVATWDPDKRTFATLDSLGQCCWRQWPGYHSYAPKSGVKLNYYENIGKYDWFISGWADWNPATRPMDTALRDEYRALRLQSNDDLSTADRYIYLSIATRVFSVVETAILARRSGKDEDSDASEKRNYSFKTRSTGIASGEVAFEYRF